MAKLVVNEERSKKNGVWHQITRGTMITSNLHILYYILYGSHGILISELLTLLNLFWVL